MSVAEAEHALGVPLTPRVEGISAECWVTQRSDGQDGGIGYMVMDDKIVVIQAAPVDVSHQATNVTDTRGIGVGASEADIRRAYGDVKIRLAPGNSIEAEIEAAKTRAELGIKLAEPEPPLDWWVEVESPNHQRALIFDTRDSRVVWLRTGLKPAVMEEGCD